MELIRTRSDWFAYACVVALWRWSSLAGKERNHLIFARISDKGHYRLVSKQAWVCYRICECDKESSEKNTCSIHLHFIVFAKTAASQNGGDKWCCVGESARSHYAALIYSVWDFDLNAGVCVLQTPLASLSEEFLHPSNSNEPTSLVIDSFLDNKVMCVLLSHDDKMRRSPPRSLPKMHSSCHTHCPTAVLIHSVRCCKW